MKSSYTGPATVFRHERDGRVWYTVAIIQTNMDGAKEYGYKIIQFKRGVDVADHAKINIKNAWEKFYTKNDEVVFYIFVNDFTLEEGSAKMPQNERHSYPKAANRIEEDPPESFEEIDEEVPF